MTNERKCEWGAMPTAVETGGVRPVSKDLRILGDADDIVIPQGKLNWNG